MLLEALDLVDPDAEAKFKDVGKNAWYYKYVATAQKLGIVKGLVGNRFNPEDILTRQDMAVMAYRSIEAAGIDLPKVKEYAEFADENYISSYAKEAVKILQQAGIPEGTSRNMFRPKNNSARAEAAKIIYMLIM